MVSYLGSLEVKIEMYTHINGKKIPLRDLKDLSRIRQDRINVYDDNGDRVLKNVDKHTVEQKLIGDNMGFFGNFKKKVNQKLDDRAREKNLKTKIDYNEQKRASKAKAETYKRKGLTEEEAQFIAEREVKRDVDTKKKAEREVRIKKATAAFSDLGKEINRTSPGTGQNKQIRKRTKHTAQRVKQTVKEELPNPNKMNFKI